MLNEEKTGSRGMRMKGTKETSGTKEIESIVPDTIADTVDENRNTPEIG